MNTEDSIRKMVDNLSGLFPEKDVRIKVEFWKYPHNTGNTIEYCLYIADIVCIGQMPTFDFLEGACAAIINMNSNYELYRKYNKE